MDTNCEITVAIAAPFTPIFNTKIKSGSKAMLITAPQITTSIPVFGNPSALIKEFIPVPIIKNNVPAR